ncbi:MAG: acetyltransferase [Phascolarctobacterium sp.]|uniref:acetyltransferase n=1 Tax=Phascolarctobacterium sp. TaxID=2049039 RepID=UPI0026DBC0D3|nr:acetyltransferase [Phascolarctobacterium sp.]MDO4922252.1 acetyltransferase [Phascolarctobacterium sp.]
MTLAIYCAGGLGKELISLARCVCVWNEIIFVDDITDDEWFEGAKVFRFDKLCEYNDNIEFIIANGEPAVREILYKKIKAAGYKMATIYGPSCCVLPGASIGEGCILCDGYISTGVVVESNVLFNGRVVIGHDAIIGAHSVLSAFCFIGGYAKIGNRVYLGPGAMVKDRVKICSDAIISLGTVILRYVKEKAIMIGNPAKRIGYNTEGRVFNMFEI